MDEPATPTIFANKVLKQLVDHILGAGGELKSKDYIAIRMVFRWLGGNWEALANGDLKHLELLKNVVMGWGQAPRPKPDTTLV